MLSERSFLLRLLTPPPEPLAHASPPPPLLAVRLGKGTQTEHALSHGWLSRLALSSGYYICPMSTCRSEIESTLMNHLKFPVAFRGIEVSQEPIMTLRGMPSAGIEDFFRKWEWDPACRSWQAESPQELRRLLRGEKFHGLAGRRMGPARLYFPTAAGTNRPCRRAKAVLTYAPPFRAWLGVAKSSQRTTLIITAKVCVLNESGVFDPPPNVQYDASATRLIRKALTAEMRLMYLKGYRLSAALLRSGGLLDEAAVVDSVDPQVEEADPEREEQEGEEEEA